MSELTEAPTSVTYSIVSPNGFSALLTIRDTEFSGKDKELGLSGKMAKIEAWLLKYNYKPQVKSFGRTEKPKEYTDYVCPECGAKVLKGETKDGKKFETCESRKYDFQTKKTTGCTYIKWL